MSRCAVVTGGNKGIGYAIVRALLKRFDGTVYLTARSADLGQEAVDKLKGENIKGPGKIAFHQCDITKPATLEVFRDHLKKTHGGLDLLINNAGIAYKQDSTAPFTEQAEMSAKTNYFGTQNACRILFPILRPHARVVNVSSMAGLLRGLTKDLGISSKDLRNTLSSDRLSMQELDTIVQTFLLLTKQGQHRDHGFPNSAYGMSKIAETAMTRVLQREVDASRPGEDIVVVSCCPGYVATDMSSFKGHLTVDQGAATPIHCAFLPEGYTEGKGQFFQVEKLSDWTAGC